MNQCARCGISEERAKLYDVISKKGIISLCAECNHIENLQVINKPSEEQILDSKNPMSKSVRERLSNMNHLRTPVYKEVSLKSLVDEKYGYKKYSAPSDLIPNFHWAIQRIRRNRKITREEFAKGIGESDATVRMIEQGYFPDSSYRIVSKIESYLGISLRKSGSPFAVNQEKKFVLDDSLNKEEEQEIKELNFEKEQTKKLTIRDLLGIKKKQQEDKSKKRPIINEENDYPMDDEQFLDNPDGLNEEDQD
jgi:ribosome-binding protein aMBF1 (putative translation factor)